MTIQEKKPLVSLLSNLIIYGVYFYIVMGKHAEMNFTTEGEIKFWATVFALLIPILIVSKIVLYIIFSIFNTAITNEKEPSFTDELDKMIDLKASRNFGVVFSIGVIASLALPAIGFNATIMFISVLVSTLIAGITLDLSQFYYYRKGI